MTIESAAIVGGGLSGLAAALHLARQGVQVDVFEAREELGGCCSTTSIGGYTFNEGAMFLAVPQLLDSAYARLGLDRAALLPLKRIDVPQASVLDSGARVVLGPERALRVDGADGAARTVAANAQLERFLDRWRPVLRVFADDLLTRPMSLTHVLASAWRYLPQLRGTLAQELTRAFEDADVRAAMSAAALYTGIAPERTPIFQVVGIVSMFEDGMHLPERGMGAIADGLAQALREAGGRIHPGTVVERIDVQGGRARALRIAGSEERAFDAIVSTVGGMNTFERLIDPAQVPAAMRRRARKAPLSHRALGVQLGLRNRLDPAAFCVNHVPAMEQQHRMHRPLPADSAWLSYTVPSIVLPQLAPAGGSVVELYAGVDPDLPLDAWDEDTTRRAADEAIARLARHATLDIAQARIVTPRDHARRLRLYEGALYGLSPAATPQQQFPHRTPLDGLYLAGQTTYPGFGVATSLWSGVFAADEALGRG